MDVLVMGSHVLERVTADHARDAHDHAGVTGR
jgi:hypothetical protein